MDNVNTLLLGVQLFNILLLGIWILLSLLALRQLRGRALTETLRLGWAALIVLVPVVGAVAFFLVQPGRTGDRP